MKFKIHYLLIPLITVLVASIGSYATTLGMPWYEGLNLPNVTPPKSAFPVAWTFIYTLTTISAILIWRCKNKTKLVIQLFVANAILNALWPVLFFGMHKIYLAFIEIILLEMTTVALVYLTWRKCHGSSVLLLPYALWGAFALYLNFLIVSLN